MHSDAWFASDQFTCRKQQFLALCAGAVTVQRQQKLTDMGATVHIQNCSGVQRNGKYKLASQFGEVWATGGGWMLRAQDWDPCLTTWKELLFSSGSTWANKCSNTCKGSKKHYLMWTASEIRFRYHLHLSLQGSEQKKSTTIQVPTAFCCSV